MINLQKRKVSYHKLLKNEEIVDQETYKNNKPVSSRPGILQGQDHPEKFKKQYLPNINFSFKKENDGSLDINIFLEKGKFVTNVYRKKMLQFVLRFCEIPSSNKYIKKCLFCREIVNHMTSLANV